MRVPDGSVASDEALLDWANWSLAMPEDVDERSSVAAPPRSSIERQGAVAPPSAAPVRGANESRQLSELSEAVAGLQQQMALVLQRLPPAPGESETAARAGELVA